MTRWERIKSLFGWRKPHPIRHSYGFRILNGIVHPIRCECGQFHPRCEKVGCTHDRF